MPFVIRHDATLVVLSLVVAYFASYTALDMGTRLRRASGKARRFWLAASAVVLGGGIWSMHFVAVLAMNIGAPVGYAPGLTAFSLLVAIAIVAVGFHVVTVREKPSIGRQLAAGAIVGAGVSVMHYSGMAAVVVPGWLQYDPKLVAVSVAIAIVAATAALWLTLNLRNWWQRAIAAGVMAVAVCGMHFTAMAATSICVSPNPHLLGGSHAGAPISDLVLAVAVCAGVFVILCLAMVCVFVDRRFELLAGREAETLRASNQRLMAEVEERQAAERELQAANDAIKSTQEAVRNLLDNAEQGFLTVGADLIVDEEASAACAAILGRSPAGEPIIDLLCADLPPDDTANVQETLESLFRDEDDYIRELKIELLPTEFQLDWTAMKVSYKFLADRQRLMLILTDVTETRRLAAAVDEERRRLEMTVLSMREGDTFWSLVADYRDFIARELPILARQAATPAGSEALYRRLHTFKGLLAQFNFRWSPLAAHDAETALAMKADAVALAGAAEPLSEALARDLAVLGPESGASAEGAAGANAASARLLEFAQGARRLLADEAAPAEPSPLRDFLETLAATGTVEVKSTLGLYGRSASQLATRLHKRLAPIEVAGEEIRLAPERYRAFLRSLIHVFRNAVDHGIETPEDRIALGKPEDGRITCATRRRRDAVEILIADDGRGIDRQALEAKLVADGERPDRASRMDLGDLVFRQGLSSRDEADATSGRGVGLSAVKHELDRLGGSVVVETCPGEGAQFVFYIPTPDAAGAGRPRTRHDMRKVAS